MVENIKITYSAMLSGKMKGQQFIFYLHILTLTNLAWSHYVKQGGDCIIVQEVA